MLHLLSLLCSKATAALHQLAMAIAAEVQSGMRPSQEQGRKASQGEAFLLLRVALARSASRVYGKHRAQSSSRSSPDLVWKFATHPRPGNRNALALGQLLNVISASYVGFRDPSAGFRRDPDCHRCPAFVSTPV